MQVLQRRWDRTFSEHSYGFRPGRSAHQAVEAAQKYIAAGYRWCVDLDLEKFFDRVSLDKLMAKIAEQVSDKRRRKLIRAFLTAGVMEGGLVSPVDEVNNSWSLIAQLLPDNTTAKTPPPKPAQLFIPSVARLVSLLVTPAHPTAAAGSTEQFTATGTFSDGAPANLTASVGWGSSAPSVTAINAAGLATTLAAGSAVITASYASAVPPVAAAGGERKSVTVGPPPILVTPSTALSSSTTLTVTGRPVGFSSTGPLNTARNAHTATLLNNGLVLIAGGCCDVNNGNPLASAELWKESDGETTQRHRISNSIQESQLKGW